jgi:hypothetical protein
MVTPPDPEPVPIPVQVSSPVLQQPPVRGRKKKAQPMSLTAFIGEIDDTETFAKLPNFGELNSKSITFSQFRCGAYFQTPFMLDGELMKSVGDLHAKLEIKPQLYATTPPIRITLYKKRIMSVDNRRLKAHQLAGAPIRFVKVLPDNLTANDRSHIDESAPSMNLHVT